MTKTKAVSFSLWGQNPKYLVGAIRNAELINKHMPDWDCVIWYDSDVLISNQLLLDTLRSLGATLFFRPPATSSGHFEYGCFWRFRTIDMPQYSHVIFRDTDSRLTPRELDAVQEWIDSEKVLHIIRDHPCHYSPYPKESPGILGGLWGMVRQDDFNMAASIDEFYAGPLHFVGYGSDQLFLDCVLSKYGHSAMIHDEVTGTGRKFRIARNGLEFCGERYDEYERPYDIDRVYLFQHLHPKKDCL